MSLARRKEGENADEQEAAGPGNICPEGSTIACAIDEMGSSPDNPEGSPDIPEGNPDANPDKRGLGESAWSNGMGD